jgi:uncharacterized protein YfaT (DUF1175 family)
MRKQKPAVELQSYSNTYKLPDKRGNGTLTNKVTYDTEDNVVSYSMAYINHTICALDNGRVIGYDNKHGQHHRHIMGKYEPVDYISYEDTVIQFDKEWQKFKDDNNEK